VLAHGDKSLHFAGVHLAGIGKLVAKRFGMLEGEQARGRHHAPPLLDAGQKQTENEARRLI